MQNKMDYPIIAMVFSLVIAIFAGFMLVVAYGIRESSQKKTIDYVVPQPSSVQNEPKD